MLQKFDERNRDLIVNINGQLVHRDQAGVSPFDSAVQGGDAVWEGLRLYDGRIFQLERAPRPAAQFGAGAGVRRDPVARGDHAARSAARSPPTGCATASTSASR